MPSILKLWLNSDDRSAWLTAYIRRKKRKIMRPKVTSVETDEGFRYRLRKWFNLYLLLDTTSTVDRRIFKESAWELDQLYLMECACKYFKSSGHFYFIDVGSYWGLYAMKAIHWGADSAIAFEPDRRNYEHLRTHLLLNNLASMITTHNLAVSDLPRTLSFRSSEMVSDGNRGAAKVVPVGDEQSRIIQAVKIDDYVALSNEKIAMKIDVEGHEVFALQGMDRLCRENTIFAQIEVWPENKEAVCTQARRLGLNLIHAIEDDLYFSNDTDFSWFHTAVQKLSGVKD